MHMHFRWPRPILIPSVFIAASLIVLGISQDFHIGRLHYYKQARYKFARKIGSPARLWFAKRAVAGT
jgi:hypothetical protein